MERLMNIINAHLDDPELNVEMLAERVGLSRVQLHRRLKELTGIPASEFIRNIRLKQAAILLKDKKMNYLPNRLCGWFCQSYPLLDSL